MNNTKLLSIECEHLKKTYYLKKKKNENGREITLKMKVQFKKKNIQYKKK